MTVADKRRPTSTRACPRTCSSRREEEEDEGKEKDKEEEARMVKRTTNDRLFSHPEKGADDGARHVDLADRTSREHPEKGTLES